MNSNGNLSADSKILVQGLNLFYGDQQALQSINMAIPEKQITALIGPSGCGKSSFLRCLNRMNDLLPHTRITGSVLVSGKNIYDRDVNEVAVRKKIGMVYSAAQPVPQVGIRQCCLRPVEARTGEKRVAVRCHGRVGAASCRAV